jgi:HEAT repeats
MPFEATCPACQKSHRLLDELDGKTIRCKGCGKSFRVEMKDDEQEDEEVVEPALVHQVLDKKPQPRPLEIAEAEEETDEPILAREIKEEIPRPRRAVVNGERDQESGPRGKSRADEEEAVPRRRSRKHTQSSFPVKLVLILGGICLVLCMGCVGVGGGIWWFASSSMALDLGGTWPEPIPIPGGPGEVVRFRIAGVTDELTREVVVAKILRLADNGPAKMSSGAWENDRMVYQIRPCADVAACAKKVDFGKVRNVSGNIITVVVDKKDIPEAKDAISVALFHLKMGDKTKALQRLQNIAPNERRAEVVKILEGMLTDSDQFTRANAVELLGKWGSKDEVPLVIGMLKDQQVVVRGKAIEVLGNFKDPRAIEPIADRLVDFFDRGPATKVLKEFGPAAEPALIARLGHKDKDVKVEACRLLKVIGSKQCVPALQQLANSEDFFVSNAAKDALRGLQNK